MKQNLLTKHCALLLLLAHATAWSTPAWADVTINVKAPSAPHMYVWNSSQTKLNGEWPGDIVTDTKVVNGETYYTKTFLNEDNVSVIFAKDNDTQTGDFTGLTGEVFFHYNGEKLAFGDLPDNAIYEPSGNFVYFVNSKNWSTVNCHVYNGNSTSTEAMTFIGNDKAGQKVYKWGPNNNLSFNPANVIFNNGNWADQGGAQTPSQSYTNGGYYVYSETNNGSNHYLDLVATIDASRITNTATYFADEHFREGITKSLGVAEGAAFTPTDYTILDLSYDSETMTGKISNLSGIEHFTNLEELYAGDNDIRFIDLENATKLRILDLHHNEYLLGFGTGTPSTSNHIARLPSGCLQYIDMSNTRLRNYTAAAFANKVAGTLETFIARDVYYTSDPAKLAFNNIPSVTSLTKLKYLDVSGCDGTPVTIVADLANMKSTLEYLDISNQHMTTTGADPALDGFTALKTFKFNNQSTWTKALSINNCPLLTYIDVSGNTAMTGLTINNSGITTLNFPEATTLTGLSALATLNVSNNPFTVLNIPQTPNSLLTVTANDCSAMSRILAEHNKSKLQYVTAHNCPALTDITINGADIYFNKQLNAFDATNKSTLLTLDLSNDAMSTNYALDGFTALQTVDFDNNYMEGNNNTIHEFTATNCPALTSVNLGGITNMQTVTLTNNGFSNRSYPLVTVDAGANNVILDFSDNNFTDVPNIQASQINVLKLNNNQLSDINIPNGCNVNYLYAQNNNFGSGAYTLPTTSLVGLDLGNNGFTKFKAENNTSLKSLALAGNTALTEIELHGNTALTQTSPDGVIESDNGLYIKGLSNLQTLNIENSSFNKFGQQNSLEGVTGLTKLQARHNEFTTFTNGVYPVGVQGTGSYRIADPSESSLEHLTGLEYLDLSYNELRDSVHLYRNVALKHLDVSHNNHITGVFDGSITTEAQKTAMLEKKAYHLMKYGNVYQTVGTNPTNSDWTNGYINFQKRRSRPFDLRTEDLNDTTGLYHLDLGQNVNLEWLDFSYTNIHNTASKPEMMNTGWIDKDWVTDMGIWDARSSSNTTAKRAYTSWHTYVYFIPCSKLKVIHADHNNMQSLGIRYFPELDTLTCSYMYGDCAYMRDFSTNSALSSGTGAITDAQVLIGMGNISLSTTVQKLKSVTWSTDNSGNPTSTLTWEGPGGLATAYYTNPIKYYDVSYSGYNEVRFYPGNTSLDLPNLEHVNVSGNPLNCQVKHYNGTTELDYSNVSNYNSLDVTYCPNIRTVLAENCSDLPIVRAHNRTKLDTLYVSNDPNLKVLYVQNDPLLKTNFVGLNTLTGLETLFGYNNTQWGNDINFSSNTALKNLWISNIGTSSINVANNANLEKLRAYDNSLTTLDLSNNGKLLWLDVARNKLPEIDLRGNSKLQFFNISNGSDTRIQLDGTEDLNHDGSDGDAIKPTTIFSADEAPIANADAGNSLSDLALPASITDARANGNDLHSITGNFANLTNIEFAHNHINGIDLSAAPGATIESRDNGRTIVADCAFFAVTQNHQVIQYKVYFFQLDATVEGNGTVLTLKDSEDLKGDTRRLGTDGMVMDNITWDGTSGSALKNTITPGDMSALDPDYVPGKIVVLNPTSESGNEAEGTATYTYQTGENSTSEFYLNWSSDGTVTGINEIKAEDGVSITNTYGNLTINGKDGTMVGVYDLNGRQVTSETIVDGSVTINGLTPGIYVVNGVKVLLK